MSEARAETLIHIREVQRNINKIMRELSRRADHHDDSKLETPEVEYFDDATERLKNLEYGTPEYFENLKNTDLAPALEHHYCNNRHHPQHFKDGIADMNLIDIIEMYCDWYASTKRNKNGNIRKSIEANGKRFGISKQLIRIFENTIEVFDK
jgi:hypothetical protein